MCVVFDSWPVNFAHKLSVDQAFFLSHSDNQVRFVDLTLLVNNFLRLINSPAYSKFYRFKIFWRRLHFFLLNARFYRHRVLFYRSRYSKNLVDTDCINCNIDRQDILKLLDSNLKDIHGNQEFTSRSLDKIVDELIVNAKKVGFLIHKFDLSKEIFYIFNGRFPLDGILEILLRNHNCNLFYFEVGERPNSIEIFKNSPHNILERRRIMQEFWDKYDNPNKQDIALQHLQNRISGKDPKSIFWTKNQLSYFPVDLPKNRKIISFFLSTEGELSAQNLDEMLLPFGSQQEALNFLLKNIDFKTWYLVIREHPSFNNFSETNNSAFDFSQYENKVLLVSKHDKSSSLDLIKKSDLVIVYSSTIAADAVFLQKPTLILGFPKFAANFHNPLSIKKISMALKEEFKPLISIRKLFTWALYSELGGRELNYCYLIKYKIH